MYTNNLWKMLVFFLVLWTPVTHAQDLDEAPSSTKQEQSPSTSEKQTESQASNLQNESTPSQGVAEEENAERSVSDSTSSEEPEPPPQVPQPTEQRPEECHPACRNGFVCTQGDCISLCNPPCNSDQQCTPAAECVPMIKSVEIDSEPTFEWPDNRAFEEHKARSYYNHDDLYLRISLGPAYVFDFMGRPKNSSAHGFALSVVNIGFGGTLEDGLVLGIGTNVIYSPEPTYKVGDRMYFKQINEFLVMGIIGPLVDYYPDPRQGFHVGARLGFAGVFFGDDEEFSNSDEKEEDEEEEDETAKPPGVALSISAGYDFWIGEQWSMGGLVQLLYVRGYDQHDVRHSVLIPILSLTVVYQ